MRHNTRCWTQGEYSQFFLIRGFEPSIYCLPKKKYQEFRHTQKIIPNFSFPKTIILTLRKSPNMYSNDPLVQFCNDPKNIHNFFIPQNIFIFLKTPKNIEIQNFKPQKMVRAYLIYETIRVPPLGCRTLSDPNSSH